MPACLGRSCSVALCAEAHDPRARQLKHLRYDHRFMVQITSSAIWNGPSPEGFVRMLNETNTAARTVQRTQEKLARIFAARLPITL